MPRKKKNDLDLSGFKHISDFNPDEDLPLPDDLDWEVVDKTFNFQAQKRVKKITVPCDKLSQILFEFFADEYAEILDNHDQCGCVESFKKSKKVVTPFWLELVEDYSDKLPPDAFTREVLFHAMNFYEQGFNHATISMTLDSLTGGEEKRNVYREQLMAIKAAIEKVAFTRIKIDLKPFFKAFPKYAANFKGDRDRAELVGTILPCELVHVEANGQATLGIKLLGESPLMTYAKLKKQLMTYDITPLAISGQHNTPQVITVKNYLLRRIKTMKRGLNNSILFKTLYENCGLAHATKWQKQDVRKTVEETLNSFKADGTIKNFEFERQGNGYRAIKIVL